MIEKQVVCKYTEKTKTKESKQGLDSLVLELLDDSKLSKISK